MRPRISVVIPTFNRRESLQRCLGALARQTCPREQFQVVVVDDGSDDGTAEYLARSDAPMPLHVLRQENRGPAAARNRGASDAAGEYLLFLDDDIVASERLLEAHLRAHAEAPGAVVLGRIKLPENMKHDWYAKAYCDAWNRRYDSLGTAPLDWRDLYSGNFSMTRKDFLDCGGFYASRAGGEDVELGWRLQASGLKFVNAPAASGIHEHVKNRDELMAQAQQQGETQCELCRRHPLTIRAVADDWQALSTAQRTLFSHLLRIRPSPSTLLLARLLLPGTTNRARLHKFIQQYGYWLGFKRALDRIESGRWTTLTRGVPILMYHALDDSAGGNRRFVISQTRFERQMRWLHDNGYRTLTLRELADFRRAGVFPPAKSVVLTFDDGYRDFSALAYPVLRRYSFSATIFLVSGLVGSVNKWDAAGELSGRPLLSWDEIHELHQAGLEVGAHSRTHVHLRASNEDECAAEIDGSRDDIRQHLGVSPAAFSYPYGDHDAKLAERVRSAGYAVACTAEDGLNTPAGDDYRLRRSEVCGSDGIWTFRLKLRLGVARLKPRHFLRLA